MQLGTHFAVKLSIDSEVDKEFDEFYLKLLFLTLGSAFFVFRVFHKLYDNLF
jgi:hypothetical protein